MHKRLKLYIGKNPIGLRRKKHKLRNLKLVRTTDSRFCTTDISELCLWLQGQLLFRQVRIHLYSPCEALSAELMMYWAEVAAGITAPSFLHIYLSPLPLAVVAICAELFSQIVSAGTVKERIASV